MLAQEKAIVIDSFWFSKKGKIICYIDNTLVLAAMFSIGGLFFYFAIKDEYILARVLIFSFFIAFGVLLGVRTAQITKTPVFFWRFFRINSDAVKEYLKKEEKAFGKKILLNEECIKKFKSEDYLEGCIKEVKSKIDKELNSAEKHGVRLKEEINELQLNVKKLLSKL